MNSGGKRWVKWFLQLSLHPQHRPARPGHVQLGRGAAVHLARPELGPQKPRMGVSAARKKPKTSCRLSRSAPAPYALSRTHCAHPRGSCTFTRCSSSCSTSARSAKRPEPRTTIGSPAFRWPPSPARLRLENTRGGGTPTRSLRVPTATGGRVSSGSMWYVVCVAVRVILTRAGHRQGHCVALRAARLSSIPAAASGHV